MPPNRLREEPSLYLQQHAGNPVDWYPWGEEALAKARDEDRPILLSIGYSACHWCHVMERESFEDEAIAAVMNEHFVCIKVDREERPDLDQLYMRAVQGMTGHGGWPMTVFLLPDGSPYYAGTYFPPEDRGNMSGFRRVLLGVSSAFRDRREEVQASAQRVADFLRTPGGRAVDGEGASSAESSADSSPDNSPDNSAGVPAAESGAALGELGRVPVGVDLSGVSARLGSLLDTEYGGFGTQPKFPSASNLEFLIARESAEPDPDRRLTLDLTLRRMSDGGVYDHLAGGFHRYSVDRYWLVPHFEKMLYDQAALASLYAEAWRSFGDPRWGEVAVDILEYVLAEMTAPEGGFYATQDADSEGEEGKFFLWDREEFVSLLPENDREMVARYFDVSEIGNFEGRNILHRTATLTELCTTWDRSPSDVEAALQAARATLLAARSGRVAPATDTKLLTDWNGLMLGVMARVGRLTGRQDFIQAAARAAERLARDLHSDTDHTPGGGHSFGGELHHVLVGESLRVPAFLDDYVFYARGLLELYLATGEPGYFAGAVAGGRIVRARFEDPAGGFFFTARDSETLVARPQESHDAATPSGNAVAAELLYRLHALTGDSDFARAAEATVRRWSVEAEKNPHGQGHLLSVIDAAASGWTTVVVAGPRAGEGSEATDRLETAALRAARNGTDVLRLDTVPGGTSSGGTSAAAPDERSPAGPFPPVAAGKALVGGEAAAYVCRGSTCSPPVTDPAALIPLLVPLLAKSA